jgi:hypothetical protein
MTMILGNWSTGSLSVFSESLYLIKGNEISKENPAPRAQKRLQHPCWERFCALEVAAPEATRRGGREAICNGHSLTKKSTDS